MYFEEIYNRVRPLWKHIYILDEQTVMKTHCKNLAEDYNKGYDIIKFKNKNLYNEWDSMLFFCMYQTLTDVALKCFENGTKQINVDKIQIEIFEENFRKNLTSEGNEIYLKMYKGIKSILN